MNRPVIIGLALAGCAVIAVTAMMRPPPRLIWNASASVPIGLYVVEPIALPKLGDLVVVNPPKLLSDFLADGGYVPEGVPLIKHVSALAGQQVCRNGRTVTVDDVPMGRALVRDSRGRSLPVWQGCVRLADGRVFLLNPDAPASLDGRYFGPLPASTIIGRARPIWTRAGG
jgi:conjugative transfer signal peptidase TraF